MTLLLALLTTLLQLHQSRCIHYKRIIRLMPLCNYNSWCLVVKCLFMPFSVKKTSQVVDIVCKNLVQVHSEHFVWGVLINVDFSHTQGSTKTRMYLWTPTQTIVSIHVTALTFTTTADCTCSNWCSITRSINEGESNQQPISIYVLTCRAPFHHTHFKVLVLVVRFAGSLTEAAEVKSQQSSVILCVSST